MTTSRVILKFSSNSFVVHQTQRMPKVLETLK